MRATVLALLAFVFVVAVSAEDSPAEDLLKRIMLRKEQIKKFFTEDELGKTIVNFISDLKKILMEGRGKARASLAAYIKKLKAEAN